MSNADRAIVAELRAASDLARLNMPMPARLIAQALSDKTFALLLSLIDRIEKLEKEKSP